MTLKEDFEKFVTDVASYVPEHFTPADSTDPTDEERLFAWLDALGEIPRDVYISKDSAGKGTLWRDVRLAEDARKPFPVLILEETSTAGLTLWPIVAALFPVREPESPRG